MFKIPTHGAATMFPSIAIDIGKIQDYVRAIEVGLLTTVDQQGGLHTRPVQTLAVDRGGLLWFFTDVHSEKAFELERDIRLSLGYADPRGRCYVAISGVGRLRRDPSKAAELWSMSQRAYYPAGPIDERLAILCVQAERAEYWLPSGRTVHLLAALKARITGIPARIVGRNSKVP